MSEDNTAAASLPAEPITVPQGERQSAVDAMVAAITANRGSPELAAVAKRTPSATFNTLTGELTYHSEEDARLAAEQAAEQNATPDPLDGASLQWELERVASELRDAHAALEAHTFDPKTGAKVFTIPEGSEAREVQKRKVEQLAQTLIYQKGVFEAALTARANRAAANNRQDDAAAIRLAITGGDPALMALYDKHLADLKMRYAAEAAIRAQLGTLGSE